ncbi:MAG TPA: stage III sporulation protein AA [Verrucomicrobiae bacterium]|nr:stage III sporulation protein AA [Verrucomicrobiae bacterium]
MALIKQVIATQSGQKPTRLDLEILPLLAPELGEKLRCISTETKLRVEEIRLRSGCPLVLRTGQGEITLTGNGQTCRDITKGFRVDGEMVRATLDIMTRSSIYAWEEEIKNGFLTLRGGHRVGLAGKAVLEGGRVKTLRPVASLNIRIAHEVKGVGSKLISYLINNSGVYNTLIISPPQAGKTTLLRDLVRLLSTGVPEIGLKGVNVGVVDERSELAGCWEGIPQNDLGPRVDILDCCPKAQGMIMLLRAMAPQVIVTDEMGKREDLHAVEEAVNGGVTILTSVHGQDVEDVMRKPVLGEILTTGVFQRIVVLSRRLGPGTVEKIWDGNLGKNLLALPYLRL